MADILHHCRRVVGRNGEPAREDPTIWTNMIVGSLTPREVPSPPGTVGANYLSLHIHTHGTVGKIPHS